MKKTHRQLVKCSLVDEKSEMFISKNNFGSKIKCSKIKCSKDSGETPQNKRPFLEKEWSFLLGSKKKSCMKETTKIDNGEYIAIKQYKKACKYSRYGKLCNVDSSLDSELFFNEFTQINKKQENI